MKFFAILIISILGGYFVLDFALNRYVQSHTAFDGKNHVLVQEMAQFLETNPSMQATIQNGGVVNTVGITSARVTHEINPTIDRYFGNTPTDQFFKNFIAQKQKIAPQQIDEETKLFIELSNFIRDHPKEAIETLEQAMHAIPADQKQLRDDLRPAYIHAAIQFIEESSSDANTRKNYLNRFTQSAADEEITNALESHFAELTDEP